MIKLIRILLDINILPKFGAYWSIFADDNVNKVKYNSFLNKEQIILTILSHLIHNWTLSRSYGQDP